MGMPWYAHVTSLFCELHWLSVCSVVVITYKPLHGIRPGYLCDCLFSMVSAWLVGARRIGMLQSLQLNNVIDQDPSGMLILSWCQPYGMRFSLKIYAVLPCWHSIQL